MSIIFRDRTEAGKMLARKLLQYAGKRDVLILGLPRGGVPVAYEIAVALCAPLDVFIVRKLGVPGQAELAMGAIATGGVRVLNEEAIRSFGIPSSVLDAVAAEELRELERREMAYRGHAMAPEVRGKTVILVDDGIATGSTMRAAVEALKRQQPGRLIIAVPAAAAATCAALRVLTEEVITLAEPENFLSVGRCYKDFSQTYDAEVKHLLSKMTKLG